MNKTTLSKLKKNRAALEGSFIMSLYSNPTESFDDYPIDPKKDLLTEDGKFYYNLGYNMVKKGIRIFDEISIMSYLSDFPTLQQQFEQKGGYKSLEELSSTLEQENTEAYYNALIKNNSLIKLCEAGFDIEDNMDLFNELSTSDEVFDYYDSLLNTLSLNSTHDISLQTLSYTKKDIELKKSGATVGFQFEKYSPLLNSFSNGIPRSGMTMLASYTNGGKTSFMFANIVVPLVEKKNKICIMSNEQEVMVFKDLLYIYVLTKRLNYWKINRNKIKTLAFDEEDKQKFKEAHKIIKEEYEPYIVYQREFDYGMASVKKTIKKLARQDVSLFIYDTFKVSSSVGDSIWQSFLNDSKDLFQIASKTNVAIITPVQLALGTKNHIRWLDESCLSNSKQIAEIYEEIFTFRDIWNDEYTSGVNDIKAYKYKTNNKGEIQYTKDENGNNIVDIEGITITPNDGKYYKIFFHTKSRNGEVGQTVLYQFRPFANEWNELGICNVGDQNK